MRAGIRLGIDPGGVRIGVAQCDRDGVLATPTSTVPHDADAVSTLVSLAEQLGASEIIVGMPLNLAGSWTESTRQAVVFARALAAATTVPVVMVDERLTTRSAQQSLRASERSTRHGRSVIDQIAAVTLLQHALDTERSTGRPAGIPVEEIDEPR